MRVLLIFPGALGDLLLLAPAAAALARGGARVEMSVQRALAPLASRVIPCVLGPPVDGVAMSSLFSDRAAPPLADWLRGANIVHAWFGAREGKVAIECEARRLGVGTVHWHAVERGDGSVHASACYANALGVAGPLPVPGLWLGGVEPQHQWAGPAAGRLVVHPGAGSAEKRWPASGFRGVADGWRRRGGEAVILLGPAEEDAVAFWQAAGHTVAAGLEILEASALVAGSPRYLGNDSGVSHLAGALDRTGAVLFGPTRPERWRPLGGTLAAIRFAPGGGTEIAAGLLERLASIAPALP